MRTDQQMYEKLMMAAAVAAVFFLAGQRAGATITLQETIEPIDPALQAEGWMGVKLSLVSDSGRTVAGMDFKNDVHLSSGWDFPKDVPIGISGPVYQDWTQIKTGIISTPSRVSLEDDTSTEDDSFFITSGIVHTEDQFAEDNDLSVSNTDGIGSFMTYSGSVFHQDQVASLDIAFLIIPANQNDVVIRGTIGDSNNYFFGIDDVLNPQSFSGTSSVQAFAFTGTAPEPATLTAGAAGIGLLLRRRRK